MIRSRCRAADSSSPSRKPPTTSRDCRNPSTTARIWQAAIETLIMAAEGRGPLMHARIGVLRALNRHVERVFNPDRKDHHWGKRKLAKDREAAAVRPFETLSR
jgi:hypothetical protein